jgi:hypothetical protein
MLITRELMRTERACYDVEKNNEGIPAEGCNLLHILGLDIPDANKLWVATRPNVLDRPIMLEWLARLVERALPIDADPRSHAIVGMLRSDSATKDAADAAADAAARAAYAARAAADAAYAADAERKHQVQDLIDLLS